MFVIIALSTTKNINRISIFHASHTYYAAKSASIGQFFGRVDAFWICGKTHRLKTMVKNAASKNAEFTPNLDKNHPRKQFFAYISQTIRDIEKSLKQKL